MNDRAASRAVSTIATPKNGAASCGVFIIPRKRDKVTRFPARLPERKYMDLVTSGREFNSDYQMPLWHNPREIFAPELGAGNRFRLILVEEGTGILRLGARRLVFSASALFFLNEIDRPELENSLNFKAQAFYFHPCLINSVFTFENIRSRAGDFNTTAIQDLHWLTPFVERRPNSQNILNLGAATAMRMGQLFDALANEISVQRDVAWPCRSRSFFLELLFLVERVYADPNPSGAMLLSEVDGSQGGMDAVILYLHTHYPEKITISDLARAFHTNRTTLTKQFHETAGFPVMAYLIRLRVQLAMLILRNTKLPVAEVLRRVGFADQANFTRHFKKYTGYPPSEYRNRYCWMMHL
jgi:AraC-like DNA-binding protein